MTSNFIKFIKVGVYKDADQARNIATVLLMSTAITPSEYTEIIVAIEQHFNPPIEEVPIQETTDEEVTEY